jgi:adenosylhomocysteine nucleosidase
MPSPERPPILVLAALSYELEHLRRAHLPEVELLETGEGVVNARKQLEGWFTKNRARAVLSIGFAGGLSPQVKIGDLVIGRTVRHSGSSDPFLIECAKSITTGYPSHVAVAVTADQVMWQAKSKEALASSLEAGEIGFVDMESTAIAEVCAKRDVPFLIARYITDAVDEDLPLDFNKYRDTDGRVDPNKVMRAALLKPSSIGGLLELRKRSKLCAARMSEFVEQMVRKIP